MKRKWEYLVTQPGLPEGATSLVMDYRQVADWLNSVDARGWEFVGYGEKQWHDAVPQAWWIFRRPAKKGRQTR